MCVDSGINELLVRVSSHLPTLTHILHASNRHDGNDRRYTFTLTHSNTHTHTHTLNDNAHVCVWCRYSVEHTIGVLSTVSCRDERQRWTFWSNTRKVNNITYTHLVSLSPHTHTHTHTHTYSVWSFLGFWIYQMLWVWIVSLPVIFCQSAQTDTAICANDIIGWCCWGIGYFFEAVADQTKHNHYQNPT